jgi:hypothetical protein
LLRADAPKREGLGAEALHFRGELTELLSEHVLSDSVRTRSADGRPCFRRLSVAEQ